MPKIYIKKWWVWTPDLRGTFRVSLWSMMSTMWLLQMLFARLMKWPSVLRLWWWTGRLCQVLFLHLLDGFCPLFSENNQFGDVKPTAHFWGSPADPGGEPTLHGGFGWPIFTSVSSFLTALVSTSTSEWNFLLWYFLEFVTWCHFSEHLVKFTSGGLWAWPFPLGEVFKGLVHCLFVEAPLLFPILHSCRKLCLSGNLSITHLICGCAAAHSLSLQSLWLLWKAGSGTLSFTHDCRTSSPLFVHLAKGLSVLWIFSRINFWFCWPACFYFI
jgi:hypothetical protein